jgi:hypothetical protein
MKACIYCKVKEGWVITAEEEAEFNDGNVKIVVKAAWKWMLE